ncbi:hypothetical protein SRHO_G00062720 [Serrasalmus rhombeus]
MPGGASFTCTDNYTQIQTRWECPATKPRRNECTLVRNVQINPRAKAKDLVEMLADAGQSVSSSTVKRSIMRAPSLIGDLGELPKSPVVMHFYVILGCQTFVKQASARRAAVKQVRSAPKFSTRNPSFVVKPELRVSDERREESVSQ